MNGKAILYLNSSEIFEKMTSLRTLDISDHPEFFMTIEKKEALEIQALQGIKPEEKAKVEFTKECITIHDILPVLNSVEDLTCDDDLEAYILGERENKGFLPNLKLLNGVSLAVTNPADRANERAAIQLMNKLPLLTNIYSVQQ